MSAKYEQPYHRKVTDNEILDGFAEARVFTEFCMTRLERRLSALDHRIMIKIGEIERSLDRVERRLVAVEKNR